MACNSWICARIFSWRGDLAGRRSLRYWIRARTYDLMWCMVGLWFEEHQTSRRASSIRTVSRLDGDSANRRSPTSALWQRGGLSFGGRSLAAGVTCCAPSAWRDCCRWVLAERAPRARRMARASRGGAGGHRAVEAVGAVRSAAARGRSPRSDAVAWWLQRWGAAGHTSGWGLLAHNAHRLQPAGQREAVACARCALVARSLAEAVRGCGMGARPVGPRAAPLIVSFAAWPPRFQRAETFRKRRSNRTVASPALASSTRDGGRRSRTRRGCVSARVRPGTE